LGGSTPHLLGRPLLFEITELDHPEADVAFRWIVSFYVANAQSFIFELRLGEEELPNSLLCKGQCYELLENGVPCSFGRWHFGPETARNSIVAVVEDYVQRTLLLSASNKRSEPARTMARQLPNDFISSLSNPGLEVLNLFRTGHSAGYL